VAGKPLIDFTGQMSRQGTRILVVEDFDSLRSLLVRVLSSEGYQTVGVSSVGEALALCVSGDVDLLVTDHAVPGGNGTEIAREALVANPDLRVLFMSGSPESTLDLDVPGAHTGFLQKPFDLDALTRLVSELLSAGS
jgi:CheY-like chemotaxis protein